MSAEREPATAGYAVVTGDGRCIAPAVRRADSPLARFLGLMGRARLGPGEGLWLEPSNGIHMFFMRFAIDAAFVDRSGRVLRVAANLRPWRLGRFALVPGSRATLEVAAGALALAGVGPGSRLQLIPAARLPLPAPPPAPSDPRPLSGGHDRPLIDSTVLGGSP